MACAAVSFLLDTVSQLLQSNVDLISGAEDELRQLKNDLGSLKSFLKETEKNSNKDESVFREMERQIKEVVFDVEDNIDSCLSLQAAKGKKVLPRVPAVRLAKEVMSLREDKVKPMSDKAWKYFANMQIGDGSGTSQQEEPLKKLLSSNVVLISGVENVLEQLKDDLGLLKSFLEEEAIDNPKKDELHLREMERQIKCLDEAARSLRENMVKPMLDKARMYSAYNTQIIGDAPWTKLRKSIRHDGVEGLGDEEVTIVKYLKEPKEELDVISIIGMPGLGKTTLAWKVFQNNDIRYEFPVRIWVYVSQEFDMRNLLLKILKEFTSQDMSEVRNEELVLKVRGYLEKERFLLVVDDIWTAEHWNAIRDALPASNGRGKVLITSRQMETGRRANRNREPYRLRFLTTEESWGLLQLGVFGNVENCPSELRGVGQCIAQQCDGLPLVIMLIGGILLDMLSITNEMTMLKRAWEEVSLNMSRTLAEDGYGRLLDMVLALSYNRLPDDLKDCFLYLGVFPADYEISTWTLTSLWIAEGFIQRKVGQSLEETAEQNLEELIMRNLVMVEKINSNGEVKTCRVSDVISGFCMGMAAKQNLFHKMRLSREGVLYDNIQRTRRVCIHSHLSEFLSLNLSGPQVRSFLCFYEELFVLHPEYISAIPSAFNLLRVLAFKSVKFTRFPMKFTKCLIHLRYISLSCDVLDVLPETISNLWNLQTLVVDAHSTSLKVQANIWRMMQLRHLKTKAAIILAVQGEGNAGRNLQTLTRLSPEYCTEEVFNRAPNLKRLGIRGKLSTFLNDMPNCSLEKLYRLENLKLVNELLLEYRQCSLPHSNCFPRNLKRLGLSGTRLDWRHMSTLGKIHTLEVLKLKNKAFLGTSWQVTGDGFPRLRFLLLENTDLVFWEASADSLPSLRCLVLRNCEELKEIPLGLAKSLEKLDIDRVRQSAVESAKKISEEKMWMHGERKDRLDGFFKLSIGHGCQ